MATLKLYQCTQHAQFTEAG